MTDQTASIYRRMKDLPSTHLLGTGTPMCAGCGGLEAINQVYDIIGVKSVFVNAAGFQTELMRLPLLIEPATYGLAIVVLLGACAAAGIVMQRLVGRLDLISVLKTRE